MRIKIGTKLTTGFMLVLLMLVALSLYSFNVNQKSLQKSVGNSSVFLAEEILNRIEQNIYLKVEVLQTHSKHILLQKTVLESNKEFEKLDSIKEYINEKEREWISAPTDEITPFMRELTGNDLANALREEFIQFYKKKYGYKVFEVVSIMNKYGANIAQTGKTLNYRQDDENWWQVAKEDGFYIGDVEYGEIIETHGIAIGARIDDKEGNLIGMMRAKVGVKEIIREAEIPLKKYETTGIKLITRNGRLIYKTRAFRFLEDVSEKDFFKKIKGGSDFFVTEEAGREKLFAYTRSKGYRDFEGHDWIFIVEHDTDEVLKSAFVLRNRIVIVSIILITISILISYFISRSIANPIKELTKVVERINTEKLDVEIDPKLIESKDEIGELAASFSRMAGNLKEAQEQLMRKEKLAAIGQLASGVGHELRNPIGVIGNSVYYLNMKLKDVDEKTKKHLDILQREVQRSNTIITDLLDFSRVKPPSLEKSDVNSLVKEALTGIKLPENITIESQFDKNLPKIPVDLEQIQRVFLNIVSNAFGAMPEGGKLEIKTGVKGDFIEIMFKDTGEGIAKENLKKIFEPLFTMKAKGIGLGLAIVKSIVDAHNGSIEVESEVGKGATFTVKLPAQGKED